MKFIYTDHFIFQVQKRRITKRLAKRIYLKSTERYFDTYINHKVAILGVRFHGKARKVMVAYDIIKDEVHLVTAYPIRDQEIANRIERERWIYEKN